jgi:transcriptional activator of cad operon
MAEQTQRMLRIGEWCVNGASGEISRNGETQRLEERTMRLLMCLAERPGQVVSIDDLLKQAWPEAVVSPDSVYQSVATLRRQLGDDPKRPAYIATAPRLGYRLVAPVSPWTEKPKAAPKVARWRLRTALICGGAAVCVLLAAVVLLRGRVAPEKSVAVLPFLDLTEQMSQEPFADGMTEELIGRLSKIPGLRVPAPTASFYFKRKQLPVAEIARRLGVTYILDGSVRKSGDRIRVAARLVSAADGFVMWSGSYDRPPGDILWVQDDIAGEVTKALRAAIPGVRARPG